MPGKFIQNHFQGVIFWLTLFNSRYFMLQRIFPLVLVILIFSACEESMILKSEKKMKEDIQGTWLRNFQGRQMTIYNCPANDDSASVQEYWTFSGDMLYTTFEYDPSLSCDRGTIDLNLTDDIDTAIISKFKIDAKIFDAFLKFQLISGAGDSVIKFVDKWEFITLDDDLLYLATDDPKGNSVLQLEFSKVK